jgi:hypothetical protein
MRVPKFPTTAAFKKADLPSEPFAFLCVNGLIFSICVRNFFRGASGRSRQRSTFSMAFSFDPSGIRRHIIPKAKCCLRALADAIRQSHAERLGGLTAGIAAGKCPEAE